MRQSQSVPPTSSPGGTARSQQKGTQRKTAPIPPLLGMYLWCAERRVGFNWFALAFQLLACIEFVLAVTHFFHDFIEVELAATTVSAELTTDSLLVKCEPFLRAWGSTSARCRAGKCPGRTVRRHTHQASNEVCQDAIDIKHLGWLTALGLGKGHRVGRCVDRTSCVRPS